MINLQFDVVTSLTLNGVESMFKLMKESDYNYQYEVLSVVENSQKPNGYDSVTVSLIVILQQYIWLLIIWI